jgi:hypothetical protein
MMRTRSFAGLILAAGMALSALCGPALAQTTISQLPAATTPLTGTELVPIVQAGQTDKVTVSNLVNNAAPGAIGSTTPSTGAFTTLNAQTSIGMGASNHVLCSATAPTISSGFGTSPSIVANNGTCAFQVNVGTGGSATSGVIGLPTATTGWSCMAADITTQSSTVNTTRQTASSTTTATLGNFNTSGAAAAWVASDHLNVQCQGF